MLPLEVASFAPSRLSLAAPHVSSKLRLRSSTLPEDLSVVESPPPPVESTASSFSNATVEAALPLAPPEDKLSLWKRRLITSEDPLSIHKWSSIVYSASALVLLTTGAVDYLSSPETFTVVPSTLMIPAYTFAISNLVMCMASVRMAFLHRRFDLTARNAFLGTAVSSLFSGFYFLWTLLNTGFILDTLLQIDEVVEGRRDRKSGEDDYQGRYIVDALGYVLPIAWGLPFILGTAYVDAVLYDRPWFFEQCQYIDQMRGFPGIQPQLCYLQVAASLAASYGSLFVTLRDKKLITKNQELAGITLFSVPTLIWAIYVTAVFFRYLEW
ncbi:expressed unknown protein [Seminavis robusta]|uniref:Uncharacterized protein n=1 Tax=Seminavis robusta TaxID=568900 RepID=A0A9N8EJ26_9STRA|nr:expressed unknown protein [Seminavis robusta]|eukprot:Sro1160_g247680.1 n/a (326) ;mRNA; r:8442-9490